MKKVLKGNLNPNEKINYTRLGGIISYDQWKKSLNAKQLSRLQEDDEAPDYYDFTVLDDIRIEPNLTYLVYLIKDTINESDEYSIQGIQYGLRQALITKSKDGTEAILVKDNDANNWISLNALMR